MRTLRWTIRVFAACVLLVCCAWVWLVHTTSGARFIVERVGVATGLEVGAIEGSIARGLDLRGVRFANDGVEVTVASLFAATDITLLPLSVTVAEARAQTVGVAIAPDDAAASGKTSAAEVLERLVLSFPLRIDDLRIDGIEIARDERRLLVDELALSGTWHEDIEVRQLAVSMAELDAEVVGTIDLQQGNAVTSDALVILKPALTRASEPLSVRLSTRGDLAGAKVLANVDRFVSIDGRVRWKGGLEAEADVTLDEFELARLVDSWPEGFPIGGDVHVFVDDTALVLRDAVLEIGGTDARVFIDARMQRDDKQVEGHIRWEQLRWPLPEQDTRVYSDSADLQLSGTVDDWTAAGTIAIAADDLPAGKFEIDGGGSRDSAHGRIVDSEVLGGRVSGEVAYKWKDARPWLARVDVTSVNLAWLFPDWPAVVSGRLDSEGTGEPFAMRANLESVEGELRGELLRADGAVDIADGNVVVRNLRVEHGDSAALLDGALMMPAGLRFDAHVADLSLYVESLHGEVVAEGSVSLAAAGFLEATLDSPALAIGDVLVTDLDAHVQATDTGQSLALNAVYDETPVRLSLSGAFADWRHPLESRFEGNVDAFDIDLGDAHSMALTRPAPVVFTKEQFRIDSLCLTAEVDASLCADVNWRQGGEYGAEMELQDVPIDFIEHVTDLPLIFDQRVSGTFAWQYSDVTGPRGSGRLTLSSGKVAPVDDPQSTVETGDGILDFEIERGRLLRGDILLPFPGRGEVSGNFSVADVSLGVESGVAGNLEVDLSSIRALSQLTNIVDNASGELRARVNLAGTVVEPLWSGELSLSNGEFSYDPIGLKLTDVELEGAMDPEFRFDVFGTFRAGRGKGEIVSRADYSNADEPGLVFRIHGDDLTVVNVPDVFVEVDADVDVALDGESLEINGKVSVPNALIKPRNLTASKINESSDVIIVAGELPDPPEQTQKQGELDYRGELNVALGQSVVIDLDLAKAKVTGAVNFDWKGRPMPVANGRYLIDGTIEAFGQVLDIAEGSVHFPKVPADKPYVRILAEREIYGNTQIKRAGVLIDGPIRRPAIEAYTQPLTTEERALTLLVTGSDFDYEQGVGAVDFGTYIAPRLFVSYGVGVFERENIISARFDLARGFGIKASSSSKESGVDLNYRFEN